MTLTIEALTTGEWSRSLASLSTYSFFATPRFLQAWVRHHQPRATPRAWRVRGADGAWRLLAVAELPASRFGTVTLLGTPEGGHCSAGVGDMPHGWLGTLMQSLRSARTEHIELVLGPLESAPDALQCGAEVEFLETWQLDLAGGPQAWEAGLDKRVRRQLRLCEREGVQTTRHGVEALAEIFSLYARALSENPARRVAYSKAFLGELLTGDGPGQAALYLTRHEGQAIAGGMLLQGGHGGLAWIGCFDRAKAQLHGNLHRHSTVIRDLAAAGDTVYDLGAAPGLPEVVSFKQKLGATARPYWRIVWRNPVLLRLRAVLGRCA